MSLPRWLDPLLDAEQMRETDEWAIETRGIPSLELMERAGEGLADAVTRHAPAGRVAVVCGKGNNGGDGLVAARLLRQAGRRSTCCSCGRASGCRVTRRRCSAAARPASPRRSMRRA